MNALPYILAAFGAAGCVLAIVAEVRRRHDNEWLLAGWNRASAIAQERSQQLWDAHTQRLDLQLKLDAIGRANSERTRKGNATRRAREIAAAQPKADEMRREMAQ